MDVINGGVTAPKGYRAAGVACGLKKNGKRDLAIVASDYPALAAGVFTKNIVKGHSLKLTMEHIKSGHAKAVIINSGNANACIGRQGDENAKEMAQLTADLMQCSPAEILTGSTGVVGMPMDMQAVRTGIKLAVAELSPDGGHIAEEAIMTTDLVAKEIAVEFDISGKKVRIGAMAKGSGMIHPNMATMISVITTDACISKELPDKVLREIAGRTFNRVSVDGDTSVCDMVILLANGMAENPTIEDSNYIHDNSSLNNSSNNNCSCDNSSYDKFKEALEFICTSLARMIAADGEGATKLIEISVKGAASENDAYNIVCSIAKSPLVKTAMFGEDANWGRIITAAGYSGAKFDPELVDISIGNIMFCRNGAALAFDETKAKDILKEKEIKIEVNLKNGLFSDRMWTCDFSYDYVKINGSYRS